MLAQPRDGHNLLLCTHFEPINTAVYRNPQFKLTDLAPISLTSKYFYGITITNALPAKDWDFFAKHAKANPGKISSATVGAGSPAEIFALQLERLTGISMTRVPYRGARRGARSPISAGTAVDADTLPLIGGEPLDHQIVQVYKILQKSPRLIQLDRKSTFGEIDLNNMRALLQTAANLTLLFDQEGVEVIQSRIAGHAALRV